MRDQAIFDTFTIDIGPRLIDWQYKDIQGKVPDRILVSAGVDGDELASIAAIDELVSYFSLHQPYYSLTFVRVVNVPGFEAGLSWNPYDGKYPKFMLPNNHPNTTTKTLMSSFYASFVKRSFFWIDLHGGNRFEKLVPFLWASQTGFRAIDSMVGSCMKKSSKPYFFEKMCWEKSKWLAMQNIAYLVIESGQLATANKPAVAFHKECVIHIASDRILSENPPQLRNTDALYAPTSGLWEPLVAPGQIVEAGQTLGIVGTSVKKLSMRVSHRSLVLYIHTLGRLEKGVELVRYSAS